MAHCATAQGHDKTQKHRHDAPRIEQLVSNLTPEQKSRIDIITSRSSKNIAFYRTQLNAVRDSIRIYMDRHDDLSSIVFPLYERESMLTSEISKEYYRAKVAIDEVLTEQQFRELHNKMKQNKPRRPKQ